MSYIAGDYLVICDRCGFQRYASDCQMTWDNLILFLSSNPHQNK